jgi:hypothetical protein
VWAQVIFDVREAFKKCSEVRKESANESLFRVWGTAWGMLWKNVVSLLFPTSVNPWGQPITCAQPPQPAKYAAIALHPLPERVSTLRNIFHLMVSLPLTPYFHPKMCNHAEDLRPRNRERRITRKVKIDDRQKFAVAPIGVNGRPETR